MTLLSEKCNDDGSRHPSFEISILTTKMQCEMQIVAMHLITPFLRMINFLATKSSFNFVTPIFFLLNFFYAPFEM